MPSARLVAGKITLDPGSSFTHFFFELAGKTCLVHRLTARSIESSIALVRSNVHILLFRNALARRPRGQTQPVSLSTATAKYGP
jgi:hypothetical protein